MKDARDVIRETVKEKEQILEILGEHRWLSINGLLRRMAGRHPEAEEQHIKAVVWGLIADEKAELTRHRKLRKIY
jgi:hypothetical protein